MRKRVWALAAALLMLPLTGCGSLLNRDYSVTVSDALPEGVHCQRMQ